MPPFTTPKTLTLSTLFLVLSLFTPLSFATKPSDLATPSKPCHKISPEITITNRHPIAAPSTLTFQASTGSTCDPSNLQFEWQFGDGHTGSGNPISHTFTQSGLFDHQLTVSSTTGESGSHSLPLYIPDDFCAIMPIALPSDLLHEAVSGDTFNPIPNGVDLGNYSFLTWQGEVSEPILAHSLLLPGDSYRYINPDQPSDHRPDITDWLQGAPGVMNSRTVRDNMDALIGKTIVLPVWDELRRSGSRFDYHTAAFARVILNDYALNGKGWISITYLGDARCYNKPPIATPIDITLDEDQAITLHLQASDLEGDPLTYLLISQPEHGELSGSKGEWLYTPHADFNGTDSFLFSAYDGEYYSEEATVSLTITPINDAPIASTESLSTHEDQPLSFTLTGTDIDGDTLEISLETQPSHGHISLTETGYLYTPDPDYNGTDSFTYQVSDGVLSSQSEVTLTLQAVNDPPILTPISKQALSPGETFSLSLTAEDIDDEQHFYILNKAPVGMSIDPETGVIQWLPEQSGSFTVEVTVTDSSGMTDSTHFIIKVAHRIVTYTIDSEFEQGSLINVGAHIPDRLKLVDDLQTFDLLWVAASGRGTLIKIDTLSGEEYWSAPTGRGRNPSRTTVDYDGNVWAGNRAENQGNKGSVIRIGMEENGQCEDRNGNGVIDTSRGRGDILPWSNTNNADDQGGVSTATDECIIGYHRVPSVNVRHLSVDQNNHIWIGGHFGSHRTFTQVNSDGELLATFNVNCGGYGGLVDSNGILWSANRTGGTRLLRYDTKNTLETEDDDHQCIRTSEAYGMGSDSLGNIWLSEYTRNRIAKYNPQGIHLGTFATGGGGYDRGVAITPNDHIWVGNSGGKDVSHLDNQGNLIAVIPVGSAPTGVAVDGAGKVWSTNRISNSASRINPTTNQVDLTVNLGSGASPYNYSDMTGSTLTGAPDRGTWTIIQDSNTPDNQWGYVTWNGYTPSDSKLSITLSVSHDGITFSPAIVAHDHQPLELIGRYLKVSVKFERSSTEKSPELFDLSIAINPLPCLDNTECNHPLALADAGEDRLVMVGETIPLDARHSSDAQNQTLDYHWEVVALPPGSHTLIDEPNSPTPHIEIDVAGIYLLKLVVHNDLYESIRDTIMLTAHRAIESPDLKGLTRSEAEAAIITSDLMVESVEYQFNTPTSPSIIRGSVIEQSPPVGTLLPEGGGISLTLSLGVEPIITGAPPTHAQEREDYFYQITATDGDHDPLTYSLQQTPSGMTLNSDTGAIHWQPMEGQAGDYPLILFVADPVGGIAEQRYTLSVAPAPINQLPVFTSIPPTVRLKVGQAYEYPLEGHDPDGGTASFYLEINGVRVK